MEWARGKKMEMDVRYWKHSRQTIKSFKYLNGQAKEKIKVN